jgi:G3E family GTPase
VHRILIEPSALAMPSALEATLRGKFLGPFVKLGPAVLVVDARPFARGEQPAPGDVSWLAPAVAESAKCAQIVVGTRVNEAEVAQAEPRLRDWAAALPGEHARRVVCLAGRCAEGFDARWLDEEQCQNAVSAV